MEIKFIVEHMTSHDAAECFRKEMIEACDKWIADVRRRQLVETRVTKSRELAAEGRAYHTVRGFLTSVVVK